MTHKALVYKVSVKQTAKERRELRPVEYLSPIACNRDYVAWGYEKWVHVTCKRCLAKRKPGGKA